MPANAPDEDGRPLVDALVQTSFVTMAVLNRVAAAEDLSLTQLRVLGILRDRRVRMSALADHLGLERSTVSGLVERAERRGLVERITDADDGRMVRVTLSASARAIAMRIEDEVERQLGGLIGALTATERRRLHRLLDQALGGTARG